MPARSKSQGTWDEEFSSYAPMWEWAIVRMALDHFFRDVVEGNVPLTNGRENWFEERVVEERVTRYHRNWALLFEGLADARLRLEGNVPHGYIKVSESLEFTFDERRKGPVPIEWGPRDDRD